MRHPPAKQRRKRRHREKEARGDQARFHLLIEQAPEAIVVYDVDLGRFVEVNASAERLFECPRERLLQSGPQDFYALEQPGNERGGGTLAAHDEQVLAGESAQFERTVRTATGKELVCEVHLVSFPSAQRRLIRASFIDISDRKRAEKALVESERKYRTLFEQAAVGVAEIDPASGRFLHVNKRYCDIVGCTADEMLQTDFQSITHPDDLEADLSNMRSLIAGAITDFSMEKRYIRKSGEIVWVNLTVYPTWISGETPSRYIAIVEDITNRKQAESALRSSEERFFKAFHATPDAIVISRASDGLLLEVNDVFTTQTGYSREEALGGTTLGLQLWADPHDRERYVDAVREHGRVKDMEAPFRTKSGSIRDGLVSGEVILVGNEGCLLTILRDITDRKCAEAVIKREHDFSEALIDSLPGVIYLYDQDMNFLRWNKNFERVTGYLPEEIVHLKPLDFFTEEESELVRSRIEEVFAKGASRVEADFVSKDGSRTPFFFTGLRTVIDGKTCLIGIGIDISERKRLEKALTVLNANLETRVAERTRELKEKSAELLSANEKLKELDQLKSMFIASMSHELRTPLNSIIGFTGMTLKGLSGELNDEQKDNLSRVYQCSKHLLSLITDVIDISKIEAGHIESYPEEVLIEELVAEALGSVRPQLNEKGLELSVEIPHALRLHIDRKRLLQCLINFLSNAVKYTESGKISVVAKAEEGAVSISVNDTGIGIAKEDQQKVFEAFERFETHLRVKAGGTGLGLYLTRKIAREILGGDVLFESREGQGSTFTLKVPRELQRDANPGDRFGEKG